MSSYHIHKTYHLMSTIILSGMVPHLNNRMVVTNSKEVVVTLVIKEVVMVVQQHSHQVPLIINLVPINKVATHKQGMVIHKVHQLVILTNNQQPLLDNMAVVASKVVTNKVGTKVMVTVTTHHQILLRQLVMVKVMVVNLVDTVSQVVKVVINLVVTSMVVDLNRKVVVMVVETEVIMVVTIEAVVVVVITVEVMIAMVTVVVVEEVMVVVIVDMEGMYF